MLQVKDICKEYKTGALVQKALNHVSLNLRDNEFVAILGPSGSGKTTLLNIIGGLDRYDSGDLVINGVSTKKYRDRDWDSYRNHTIGFVFQSYNLIPHQTVLANVELALTISGISRAERRRRAAEALEKVGLGQQMHKKPSQMSGGQMQRVAIARALVNDPDILLADEPTGALDSETSIQVMNLLKEVANDRLVVMVTHNPELAEQYATRIVRLKDGVIQSDSNPLAAEAEEGVHRQFGKSSMSFLTALGLSFNNLKTKLTRTLLVALAGSIGITGIALILSLSSGVNQYIKAIEENTLSEYPLEISGSSFDMASFMNVQIQSMQSDAEVVEWKTLSNMLTKFSANDLASLRTYLETEDSQVDSYARAIEYNYGITPEIYRVEGNRYYQVNPDTTFSDMGFSGMSMNPFMQSTNSFLMLPEEKSLYLDQYEVKAGHWPENDNELVLVLSDAGRLADLTLYALGLKDHDELDTLVKQYMAGEEVTIDDTVGEYRYTDFLGLTFKLVHRCDYYQYDPEYKVWTSKTEDRQYMRNLIESGEELTVVGVVQPKEDASVSMLSSGVYYRPALVRDAVEYAANSEIVKAQLAYPDTDIISNTPFGQETDGSFDLHDLFSVDEDALANAFSFDASALQLSVPNIDLSSIDLSKLGLEDLRLPEMDAEELFGKIQITLKPEDLTDLFSDLLEDYIASQNGDPTTDLTRLPAAIEEYLASEEAKQILRDNLAEILAQAGMDAITGDALRDAVEAVLEGYLSYAQENGITDLSGLSDFLSTEAGRQILTDQALRIVELLASTEIPEGAAAKLQKELLDGYAAYAAEHGLPDIEKVQQGFSQWLQSESVRNRILETAKNAIDTSEFETAAAEWMEELTGQLGETMSGVTEKLMEQVGSLLAGAMYDTMQQMTGSMMNAVSVDGDAFAKAFKVTMTEEELKELMAVMMTQTVTSFDGNLSKMGYANLSKPSSITIYPRDFQSKAMIKQILDDYNEEVKANGMVEKVISYTDIVGTMMTSVTDIINAISYVLVAFVAISLVVSSIMIGVITYISVLERKKEIGILRAIGASKRNISEVFNAETMIIGLLAGMIGIGMTELILIPGNIVIHHLTGMDNLSAYLTPTAAFVLVSLSVLLTLLGGLVPSRKAAKSDPVSALRSE